MSNTYLYLNSRDAISTENSDIHWQLNWSGIDNHNFLLHVESISFPNVVYNVNSNYNTINLTDVGGTVTITLTTQNYTVTELVTELETKLNASSLSGTFTVTYSSQTFKLTIASDLVFTINSGTACELCGFTQLPTASATSAVGDSPVRLDGTTYVDIITSIGKSSYSSNSLTNIFYRIPVHQRLGDLVYYQSTLADGIKIQDTQLTSFNLRLRDDHNNAYELPRNCYLSLVLKLIPMN